MRDELVPEIVLAIGIARSHREPLKLLTPTWILGDLRTMDVETVVDLELQLADLWRYFVKWVSLRYKTKDSNRRRWPVQFFWQIVCNAVPAFGVVTGVARIVQRKPRVESLLRLVRGVLVSMAALEHTTPGVGDGWDTESDIPGAAESIMDKVREWLSEDDFRRDVERGAGRLAIMG